MDESRKVTDLTDEELMKVLAFDIKMSKHYYARKEEDLKEIERRAGNNAL
ncbi:MAG: hypothetical protein HFJ20_03225 [Clostridia bacterium]|nr:hypothetical protein [Clostridia bacterium]